MKALAVLLIGAIAFMLGRGGKKKVPKRESERDSEDITPAIPEPETEPETAESKPKKKKKKPKPASDDTPFDAVPGLNQGQWRKLVETSKDELIKPEDLPGIVNRYMRAVHNSPFLKALIGAETKWAESAISMSGLVGIGIKFGDGGMKRFAEIVADNEGDKEEDKIFLLKVKSALEAYNGIF